MKLRENVTLCELRANQQTVILNESCRFVKKDHFFLVDKEEPNPAIKGEGHGTCEELGSSTEEPLGVWGTVCWESH